MHASGSSLEHRIAATSGNEDAVVSPVRSERQRWMGILARASRDELEAAWNALEERPAYAWLRRPEVGLVMVRARAGGTGNPFNFGEMTVTRCALRLANGAVGFGYVQGRDRRRAELAAVFDALMQDADRRDKLGATVIEPLRVAQAERRAFVSRKAGATKVEFFTLVRGDNPK